MADAWGGGGMDEKDQLRECVVRLKNADDYIRKLEDALLCFYHEVDGPTLVALDEECPGVLDFAAKLHVEIEHREHVRENVWYAKSK